jgi:two-component system chemotaxis response regulator CheB
VTRVRVLVVEDSATVRRRLVRAIEADDGCAVVGEAADGDTAIELCERLRPDVITLDMVLPRQSGLAVTEHVMAFCPTPILIVSASAEGGEALRTFDALAAGAVDVLEKPQGDADDHRWDARFVAAVKLVSRIRVITHVRGRLRPTPAPQPPAAEPSGRYRLIAIGASTGGPAALVEALRPLPRTFPLPILLVLHIGAMFGEAFAAWLGRQLSIPVTLAADGSPLPPAGAPGLMIMAPAGRHLVVRRSRLRLTTDPERHSCRPSVDALFESVAAEVGPEAIGCLLTGMGRDGAEGLLALRRAGAVTLAQDEASSVVFGMPREAIALGAADRVLPPRELGAALLMLSTSQKERR